MPLSMSESKAVNDLAGLLYGFLPGTPHPYGNQSISFAGVARDLGLAKFWPGGSKRPALVSLLGKTLELYRGQFCGLILEIIRRGMTYRTQHGEPITREEIKQLNQVILQVKFKIPELWDPVFLNSLPSQEVNSGEKSGGKDKVDLEKLKQQFTNLLKLKPQARGFEFERFLQDLFDAFGLAPRSSFRLVGEQIDGSFQLEGDTYLVEAKWQDQLVGNAELLIFQGKVEGKSAWFFEV